MTKFLTNFKDNSAFLEIVGEDSDKNEYFIEFLDLNTNNIEYSTVLYINHWSKLNDIENKNITIKITSNEQVIFERNINDKFDCVYVLFGSRAIGDTVA
jgi:hypothetical protein